jgi:mannose-6-phosphate isomerase-like protein (cupin superfamily)
MPFDTEPTASVVSPADSDTKAPDPGLETTTPGSSLALRRAFVATQKDTPDYNAPDGSEITYLIKGQMGDCGDLCNCKLPIGKTSTAVKHQTVQELWNFTAGKGEFWLKDGENETVSEVKKGTSILIHPGVSFQFRNTSEDIALESTITTMPPWPGPDEAVVVEGRWVPSAHSQHLQEAVRPVSPSRIKSSVFGSSVKTDDAPKESMLDNYIRRCQKVIDLANERLQELAGDLKKSPEDSPLRFWALHTRLNEDAKIHQAEETIYTLERIKQGYPITKEVQGKLLRALAGDPDIILMLTEYPSIVCNKYSSIR